MGQSRIENAECGINKKEKAGEGGVVVSTLVCCIVPRIAFPDLVVGYVGGWSW